MVLLLLSLIIISAVELPRLFKEQMWRELAVFSFLLGAGALLGFARVWDIPLPNPTTLTQAAFAPLVRVLAHFLST